MSADQASEPNKEHLWLALAALSLDTVGPVVPYIVRRSAVPSATMTARQVLLSSGDKARSGLAPRRPFGSLKGRLSDPGLLSLEPLSDSISKALIELTYAVVETPAEARACFQWSVLLHSLVHEGRTAELGVSTKSRATVDRIVREHIPSPRAEEELEVGCDRLLQGVGTSWDVSMTEVCRLDFDEDLPERLQHALVVLGARRVLSSLRRLLGPSDQRQLLKWAHAEQATRPLRYGSTPVAL